MQSRSTVVLDVCLQLLKPLVALLLRHGVTYPAFSVALKRVFLEAAQDELRSQGAAQTDSAVSLRSGIHRRDVREMARPENPDTQPNAPVPKPMNMAAQVVARWLSDPLFLDADGAPKPLLRVRKVDGFDALVKGVSSDIRPRAVLDELVRLGIALDTPDGVVLSSPGFAPRQGFVEMSQLFKANLHDHLAAAGQNLDGDKNFLEQSIFVDQITEQSAHRLHIVSAKAWRQAFKTVMQEAAARFEQDQREAAPHELTHRARFGVYFYSQQEDLPHAQLNSAGDPVSKATHDAAPRRKPKR